MKESTKSKKKTTKTGIFDFDAYFKSEINAGTCVSSKCKTFTFSIPKHSPYRKSQSKGFR
jgi:hypothetical protein